MSDTIIGPTDITPPVSIKANPDYVPAYIEKPARWLYDLDPANGISRTTYIGEVYVGPNQVATKADIAAATTGVSSFNTRTGAVVLSTADITGAGGAPQASPTFSGVPNAPTAAPGTNTTQLATCMFVTAAIGNVTGAMVSSFNGRIGAVSLTASDITSIGGALTASPAFTGTPTTPTASAGTASSQIASTQFVSNAIAGAVVSWNGRTGNVSLTLSDVQSVGGAPINSPNFTGTPAGPTATAGTSTTQLATCAFVTNAIVASTGGVSSFNTRTGAVTLTLSDVTTVGGAPLLSPTFTGTPAAPTPTAGDNTTKLATTAFVATAIGSMAPVVQTFNGRSGAVTLTLADVTSVGGAPLASPTFSGTVAAPTPTAGDNSTKVSTTAFVANAIAPLATSASVAATYVPLAGGVEITGNIAMGAPLPADASPTGQLLAAGNTSGNYALNAYVDNASQWRRNNPTYLPALFSSSTTNTAIQVAPAGAVDSVITWAPSAYFNGNGIAFPSVGIGGYGNYFAFGYDTVSNASRAAVSYSANGTGGNTNWIIASQTVAGTYYAILSEAVSGPLNTATGWTNGNSSFSWSTVACDRNLKHNLSPAIGDALATVNAIDVYDCDYQHPATDHPPERWDYTLVADEVNAHLPFAYIAPPENGYASLHPLHLIATLWRAVQQLTDRVASLEAGLAPPATAA